MPNRNKSLPHLKKSERAKERILEAARQNFARDGYEGATIRAIAADAAINQSMVIRYFGSKEDLFTAVASLDFKAPELAGIPRTQLGEALVKHVLELWDDPKEGATLAAMMRASISSETARQRVVAQFVGQVGAVFAAVGADALPAAPFIATQILGMTMARYIWKIPLVVAQTNEILVKKIGKTIQRYLDEAET